MGSIEGKKGLEYHESCSQQTSPFIENIVLVIPTMSHTSVKPFQRLLHVMNIGYYRLTLHAINVNPTIIGPQEDLIKPYIDL